MAIDLERFPASETAQRMIRRVSPVYDRSYVAKWLYQVMGLEWDEVWRIMDSMWEQPFLEQATWGLRYWEQAYGLATDETKSYEERRRIVSAKRSYKRPMNPAGLEAVLSNFTGGIAVVTENVAPYTFSVELDSLGNPIDYHAVSQLIRRLKPSHLSLRLYLIASTRVRINPKAGKYRFPYHMTGEYPDINTVAGLDTACIDVRSEAQGYPFAFPQTGPHPAGTLPEESTLGFVQETAVKARADGQASLFPYGMTGERDAGSTPEESILGRIQNLGVHAEADGQAVTFPYYRAGMCPDVNTAGHLQDVKLREKTTGESQVFPYFAAGQAPEINTAFAIRNAEIQNSVEGLAVPFAYAPAGEQDAGTLPDFSTAGISRTATVPITTDGIGVVFPYSAAGAAPGNNLEGAVSASDVSDIAYGSGTVIDYPLCGEFDD